MNGGKVIFHFEGDDSQLKKTESNAVKGVTKTGSIIKGVVGGLGLTALVGKAMSTISSSIDGAVSRVDTLNNFPKVMENMQISAEDSEKAIKKVSDGIQGLPTTLDSAAAAVQRFTSVNSDVNESADIFLAVNDAIVAGGASAEIQASAMEQLSQAYAKGKPDMMEWRSIQTAMPAQLKQVAIAMGYGADGVGALGEDLRKGNVSMDDFIGTIQKLDTEGANGFKSFSDQAQSAVGGIGTSITNAKTAVVRGVGNIINSVNDALEPWGGLSGVISKVGKVAEQVLSKIGEYLPTIISIATKIISVLSKIAPFIAPIIAGIIAYNAVMGVMNAITTAVTVAQGLLNAVMLMNPIGLIIAAIVALVAAFVILWNKCEGFRNFWKGLWEGIKVVFTAVWEGIKAGWNAIATFFTETIPNAFNKVVNFFKNLPKNIATWLLKVINKVITWRNNLINKAKEIGSKFITTFIDFIKKLPGKLWEWCKKAINKVGEFKTKIVTKIKDVGKNLVQGLWNGIKNAKDWVLDKITGFGKSILKGIKKIFGIHSPSKVMFEIGGFIDEGFINGIESMKKQVQTSFGGVFDLSPSLYGTASTNLSPNVNVNVNNNMSMDPLGRVVSDIKTFSGGAKNDYNYGMGGGI